MTEMPGTQATPSGMSQEDAEALAAQIRAAGYYALPVRVSWGEADPQPWFVQAVTQMGSTSFFSPTDWERDPSNPLQTEPEGW